MKPDANHSGSSTFASLALTSMLIGTAAVGNSLVLYILWDVDNEEWLNCFLCGLLVAQPCLLSIWCASVNQRLILKFSLSMGILLALLFLFLLTLRSLDQRISMPLEIPIVFVGIAIGLSLMVQTPLLFFRRLTNQAISIGQTRTASTLDKQFGIKHLLITTAIVALLVVLIQKTFATLGFEGDAPWIDILTFLISLAVLTTAICLSSFGLVFLGRVRVASGVALALVVILGSLAVYWILVTGVFPDGSDVLFNILAYAIGLAGTINAVLLGFYAIGYRMQKLAPGG